MKKVSDVSRLTGLSRRTLQYYDDEGLVTAPRSEQNYRLYGDEELDRIWEILVLRELGQDLCTIRRILDDGRTRSADPAVLKEPILDEMNRLNETIELIEYAASAGFPPRPSGADLGSRTYIEWIAAWRRHALNEKRDHE